MPPADWRRMDQESYLVGKAMRFGRWKQPSPGADHGHCSFCWLKVTDGGAGYATADNRHDWVCPMLRRLQVEFGRTVICPETGS